MHISGRVQALCRQYSTPIFPVALPVQPVARALVIATRLRSGSVEKMPADYLRDVPPLWAIWLRILAGESPDVWSVWRRMFRSPTPAPLNSWSGEVPIEAFVFNELTTIHAAFNLATYSRNPAMLGDLEPVIQWHLENTQPDTATTHPWALAAFAVLDPSGTFADEQLHDSATMLHRTVPDSEDHQLTLALLHDALATLSPAEAPEGPT